MGALAIFLPIIIYTIGIKWLFDRFYKGKSKIKKRVFFILLVTLPFWDHIAGYIYFKYLCFTKGGVKVYKTVTNLQEQKDYWFYEGLNNTEYHNKNKEYKYFASNKLIRRNGKCLNPVKKDGNLICAKKDIQIVYLNYCNDKYNDLKITDKNYKNSCKSTDEIIKKYDLKNVIRVPESPYVLGIRKKRKLVSKIFKIYETYSYSENIDNNEILTEHYGYEFRGAGWYVNTFNVFKIRHPFCRGSIKPQKYEELFNKVGALETIIPNPYKQNIKGK